MKQLFLEFIAVFKCFSLESGEDLVVSDTIEETVSFSLYGVYFCIFSVIQ